MKYLELIRKKAVIDNRVRTACEKARRESENACLAAEELAKAGAKIERLRVEKRGSGSQVVVETMPRKCSTPRRSGC